MEEIHNDDLNMFPEACSAKGRRSQDGKDFTCMQKVYENGMH